ncbi:hypothetical protein IJ670_07365 [bacterium]|nr:hypothetical protein [bacterium]
MNIAPLNSFLTINRIPSFRSNRNIYGLKKDTVSFKSKDNLSSNINQGVDLGSEIYAKLKTSGGFNVINFFSKKEKNISVLPIHELYRTIPDAEDYDAYVMWDIKDNSFQKPKMFVANAPKRNSDASKMLYSMTVAHEYTHIRQILNGDETKFLKTLSSQNPRYVKSVIALGDAVFKFFDTQMQANFAINTFDNNDKMTVAMNGEITPLPKAITKNQALQDNGFSSDEEFKQFVNAMYEKLFYEVLKYTIQEGPYVEKEIAQNVKVLLQDSENMDKLRYDVCKYCSHNALREYEAYKTESETAKKIMNTKGTLSTDVFCYYYKMLEEALN